MWRKQVLATAEGQTQTTENVWVPFLLQNGDSCQYITVFAMKDKRRCALLTVEENKTYCNLTCWNGRRESVNMIRTDRQTSVEGSCGGRVGGLPQMGSNVMPINSSASLPHGIPDRSISVEPRGSLLMFWIYADCWHLFTMWPWQLTVICNWNVNLKWLVLPSPFGTKMPY